MKNETTAQCDCAKEYKCNDLKQMTMHRNNDYAKKEMKQNLESFSRSVLRCCYPKEFFESDEYLEMDLSKKLSMALNLCNIDEFIDCIIEED